MQKSKEHIQSSAVKHIIRQYQPEITEIAIRTFVERPDEQKQLTYAINTMISNQSFYLIIGNRGAGKTTLVNKVCQGRKGVVNVVIDENTKPEDIAWQILKSCEVTKDKIGEDSPLKYFVEICHLAAKQGVSPLVSFEITQHTRVDTFVAATKIAKYLTCDASCAAVLLNVSTALLALSMIPDPRCKYIEIGPFTDDQASLYLKKLEEFDKRKLDDDQKVLVFERLGTYPYQLWDIVNSQRDPGSYIEAEVLHCKSNVYQSIVTSPKYAQLYREMLQQPSKEIVQNQALEILETTMGHVGVHMREFQVLNYHPEIPGRFTFRTKAIETAVSSHPLVVNSELNHWIQWFYCFKWF